MDKVLETREKALKSLRAADYILTQTFPVIDDPKLMLNVLEDLFLCATNTMAALLYKERDERKIHPFHDNFDSKFNSFKMNIVRKYNINKDHVEFLQELKDLLAFHKKSPVEFRKDDDFVMCSKEYRLKKLTPELMKRYYGKAKLFIEDIFYLIDNPQVAEDG